MLFQIFGLKHCVSIGAGLGYCCHYVRAWPTQLEINTGKERKRKADRQKYSYAKAPFEESKIYENIGGVVFSFSKLIHILTPKKKEKGNGQ